MDVSHLHKSCIPKLELTREERIIEISNPRWIGYPLAHQVLQRFDDLLRHPRVSRMPNLMLIGRTNNGKTDLVKRFCQKHLPDSDFDHEGINAPVMFIQAPPSPNEGDLYASILSSLYERVPTSSVSAKRDRAIKVLRQIKLKVLCLDELHNSMAGSTTKRQQFLNTIKYLGNELNISFIASGTEDLLRATSIDPQIQNRFTPILLPKWKMDKDYRQLLKSFESILPLKEASNLHISPLAQKTLSMTEGTIGELSLLINQAAIFALRAGEEKITSEILSKCGYVPPSERVRDAMKLV